MRGFLLSILFLSFISVSIAASGNTTIYGEKFKELIKSGVKTRLNPLNAASCENVQDDIDQHCQDPLNCKEAQNYVDCAINIVRQDCGQSEVQEVCNEFNQGIQGQNECSVKCSGNSMAFFGSFVAVLAYKLIFEKMISTF